MLCTLLSACEGEHPVECLCTLFPFVQGFCPTGFTLTNTLHKEENQLASFGSLAEKLAGSCSIEG
ncbi:hypothetical protein LXL04_038210 [Taraxacum kok-saghyz]